MIVGTASIQVDVVFDAQIINCNRVDSVAGFNGGVSAGSHIGDRNNVVVVFARDQNRTATVNVIEFQCVVTIARELFKTLDFNVMHERGVIAHIGTNTQTLRKYQSLNRCVVVARVQLDVNVVQGRRHNKRVGASIDRGVANGKDCCRAIGATRHDDLVALGVANDLQEAVIDRGRDVTCEHLAWLEYLVGVAVVLLAELFHGCCIKSEKALVIELGGLECSTIQIKSGYGIGETLRKMHAHSISSTG